MPHREGPLSQPPRDLRIQLWGLRFAPYLFLIMPAAAVVALTVVSMEGRGDSRLWLAAPAILFPALLFFWLRSMLRRLRESAIEAADLFTRVAPRRCVLQRIGVAGASEEVYTLHDEDAPDERPLMAAALRFARRTWKRPTAAPVAVYLDPNGLSPYLGLLTPKATGWGERVSHESLEASWRATRGLFLGLACLAPLLFLAIGGVLYMQYQRLTEEISLAKASLDWPVAQGAMVESRVEATRIRFGKSSHQGFKAVLTYEYSVAGQTYVGHRAHYSYKPASQREPAEALVKAYPEGAAVTVRYDPHSPSRAVLTPGRWEGLEQERLQLQMGIPIASLLLLPSCFCLVALWIINRRRKALRARLEEMGLLSCVAMV